jgi:SulP family sulfate permease
MSELTDTATVARDQHDAPDLPDSVAVYAIRGPLFFGAAEKALSVLRKFNPEIHVVIIDFRAVPMLDMTALAALSNVLIDYQKNNIGIIFLGASAKVRHKMRRAGISLAHNKLAYVNNFTMAQARAQRWLDADTEHAQDNNSAETKDETPSVPS